MRLSSLALLGFLTLAASFAGARELYWRELAVTAELDGEGRLHVEEQHAMVFTGDWNGGERMFSIRTGQHLELHSVERLDPERGPIALIRGDLDRVDAWDWASNDTVRWRSRQPSDPAFDHTEIVYRLAYTMTDILQISGAGYLLDHDFAFANREGVIERFTLDLTLAPEWRAEPGFDGRLEIADLQPGFGVVVSPTLDHVEDRPLAGVTRPIDDLWRHAALAATLAAMGALYFGFRRREHALGRFDRLAAPPPLDPDFVREHVLSWRPEEVGALWDEKVGPPEVAALIARLVHEGQLASSVRQAGRFFKRSVLELELLQDDRELEGHALKLLGKLFFARRKKVDTDALRTHYRTSGFDPAGVIRPGIESAIRKRLGKPRAPERASYRRTLFLFLAAAAAGITETLMRPEPSLSWAFLGFVLWAVLFGLGSAVASAYPRQLSALGLRQLGWILPAVALALAYWWLPTAVRFFNDALAPRYLGTLSLSLIAVASFSSLLRRAATQAPAERLMQRRRLALVRDWWRHELDQETPRLDDELFPYLIAFGLEKRVDRWFRAHGGHVSTARAGGLGSTSSGGSGSRSWTGGGGAFGGAGATSAWTVAAAGLAGGVSAASSSSGGGGSSGGGSSGGGGGGGW